MFHKGMWEVGHMTHGQYTKVQVKEEVIESSLIKRLSTTGMSKDARLVNFQVF